MGVHNGVIEGISTPPLKLKLCIHVFPYFPSQKIFTPLPKTYARHCKKYINLYLILFNSFLLAKLLYKHVLVCLCFSKIRMINLYKFSFRLLNILSIKLSGTLQMLLFVCLSVFDLLIFAFMNVVTLVFSINISYPYFLNDNKYGKVKKQTHRQTRQHSKR